MQTFLYMELSIWYESLQGPRPLRAKTRRERLAAELTIARRKWRRVAHCKSNLYCSVVVWNMLKWQPSEWLLNSCARLWLGKKDRIVYDFGDILAIFQRILQVSFESFWNSYTFLEDVWKPNPPMTKEENPIVVLVSVVPTAMLESRIV